MCGELPAAGYLAIVLQSVGHMHQCLEVSSMAERTAADSNVQLELQSFPRRFQACFLCCYPQDMDLTSGASCNVLQSSTVATMSSIVGLVKGKPRVDMTATAVVN